MKKSDLVKIIKEAVREEVRAVLKEELGQAKSPSTPNEFSNMMEHAEGLFGKKQSKKQFVKDPVLNEVLNETANSPGAEEWPTMGGKTLQSKHAKAGKPGLASLMGMESMDQAFGSKPSIQQMLPDDKKHVEVPEEIGKALTRDYSTLMKAMDKKRASK
jgi:hypothetical protein